MTVSSIPLTSSLQTLCQLLAEARFRAEERARVTHERFNVFTTLLRVNDEVRLHTRILHCLLDPEGTHDCGVLFLDLFFSTLAEHFPLDANGDPVVWNPVPTPASWNVQKEASVVEGRIDLLLECTGCGIAIENKIDAYEQPRQLARYASYLNRRYPMAGRLMYLTLDGKASTTHCGEPYLRISYSKHILVWLEKCLQASYSIIPINQVLLQYREVVRQLTGQTLNAALMDTIVDFILQHPDIIRFRQQIEQGISNARAVFWDRVVDGIKKNLEPEYQIKLRAKLDEGRFGADPNGALIITPPLSSPLHGQPFEIWVEHVAKWEDALIIGIESKYSKPELSIETKELLLRMNTLLDEHESITGYDKVDPRETAALTYWPTGSHNLRHPVYDEDVADMLANFDQTVISLSDGIREHIKLLERVYLKAKSPDATETIPV